MSRMVFPTHCAKKMSLLIFFSASLLGVLGRGSPFLIIGILLVVPFFLTSKLMRILHVSTHISSIKLT
jgi:hypothetical protein